MRVGITGSSGFIGTALSRALDERGDEVVRFVRPDSAPTRGLRVRWDPTRQILDEGDLRQVGGFDAVVNLAGSGIADRRWSPTRKLDISHSRLDTTKLLVEALRSLSSGVGIFASGSAIGYYGSREGFELDESSPQGGDFLAEVCGQWEAAALALGTTGTPVALLRTGIVMSRRGGALKKQLPLFRFGLGGQLSNGEQWLSPISLRDEIRAILWVLDHKIPGPINLVAPEASTNRNFTKLLAAEMSRPALVRVPAFALRIVFGKELVTNAVLASQRVTPKVLTEVGFSFDDPTLKSIIRSALDD